jgi:DnaJ-class molecular chaperone
MRYIDQIIKAAPGFEVCPKCNGTGKVDEYLLHGAVVDDECLLCSGKGEIDWVNFLLYPNKNKKEIN